MFRLRISNNIPELVNSTTQSMQLSNRNQTPISRTKKSTNNNNNNNNYNNNKNSSFNTYTMNSKVNSPSTTPDILLPMIQKNNKKQKINSSKKSIASSSTKITKYSSDISDPETNLDSSIEHCDCILCASHIVRKTKKMTDQQNEMYLVDSKNFLNCLNTLKPTVKYDREMNQFSDVNYVGSSQQINSIDTNNFNSESNLIKIKNNNQVIKLIPANSRIKLWDTNEVTNYINSNRRPSTEIKKNSKIQTETTSPNNALSDRQSRLAKIFKEFRINPNLTPLIYRNNLVTSIGFQDNTQVPIIKNMPITNITARTTPTHVYRVPAPSALNFYDY